MTGEQPTPRILGDPEPVPEVEDRDLLTPRERQVLLYLAHGHTIASCAKRLRLTRATVKSHLGHVHGKLGAHTQAHAIVLALKAGHISLDQIRPPRPRQP